MYQSNSSPRNIVQDHSFLKGKKGREKMYVTLCWIVVAWYCVARYGTDLIGSFGRGGNKLLGPRMHRAIDKSKAKEMVN